jgi:hypothetical protein
VAARWMSEGDKVMERGPRPLLIISGAHRRLRRRGPLLSSFDARCCVGSEFRPWQSLLITPRGRAPRSLVAATSLYLSVPKAEGNHASQA